MEDTIRGNGLYHVHDALARLAANPAALDRALQRFGGDGDDVLPPPYRPSPSETGTTTRSESPSSFPTEGPEAVAAQRKQREMDLGFLHELSLPLSQFESQSWDLATRLAMLRFDEEEQGQPFPPRGSNKRSSIIRDQLGKAEGIIRARWQEQGLWSDAWQNEPPRNARWPHEDHQPSLCADPAAPQTPRTRTKRTRATEAVAATAASRPYNQFMYQVAKERDLLLGLAGDLDPPPLPQRKTHMFRTRWPGDPILSPASEVAADKAYERKRLRSLRPPVPAPLKKAPSDVHSTAYETVKEAWVQWKIWDPRWTILPGLHWMHEEPLERFIRRRMAEEDGVEWNEEEEDEEEEEEEEEEEDDEEELSRLRANTDIRSPYPVDAGHGTADAFSMSDEAERIPNAKPTTAIGLFGLPDEAKHEPSASSPPTPPPSIPVLASPGNNDAAPDGPSPLQRNKRTAATAEAQESEARESEVRESESRESEARESETRPARPTKRSRAAANSGSDDAGSDNGDDGHGEAAVSGSSTGTIF